MAGQSSSEVSSSIAVPPPANAPSRRSRRYLALILFVAFGLRLTLLVAAQHHDTAVLTSDSPTYLAPAASLAMNGSFSDSGRPVTLRTPGYPLFLVLCGYPAHGYGGALAVQLSLAVLFVYLTWVLGCMLVGEKVGLIAAGFQALSIAAIESSVRVMTDTLFSVIFLAALLLLVRYAKDGTAWLVVCSAALCAAGAYVRPVMFAFVPFAVVLLWFGHKRLRHSGLFLLVFALLAGPWLARNYTVAGYTGFSSVTEYQMLFVEAAAVQARAEGISAVSARHALEVEFERRLAVMGAGRNSPEAIRLESAMAKPILLAHPLQFVQVRTLPLIAVFFPAGTEILEMFHVAEGGRGTLSVLQTRGVFAAIEHYFAGNWKAALLLIPELLVLAIAYLGCLMDALRPHRFGGRKWRWADWLIFSAIVAFVFASGAGSVQRYRIPIEPAIYVLAGAGLAALPWPRPSADCGQKQA
jgi:4-amino-4-deoxy-L-arabinose transferase-like glycosyltransferase